jgi:hypothetical protein
LPAAASVAAVMLALALTLATQMHA